VDGYAGIHGANWARGDYRARHENYRRDRRNRTNGHPREYRRDGYAGNTALPAQPGTQGIRVIAARPPVSVGHTGSYGGVRTVGAEECKGAKWTQRGEQATGNAALQLVRWACNEGWRLESPSMSTNVMSHAHGPRVPNSPSNSNYTAVGPGSIVRDCIEQYYVALVARVADGNRKRRHAVCF